MIIMKIENMITATEAIRSFADIINKVYYQNQSFDIKKGKIIVASIVPSSNSSPLEAKDLNQFFSNIPKLENNDEKDFQNEIENIRSELKVREIDWD